MLAFGVQNGGKEFTALYNNASKTKKRKNVNIISSSTRK